MHKYIVTFSVGVLISSCTGSYGISPFSTSSSATLPAVISTDHMVTTASSTAAVTDDVVREYTQADFARMDHNLLELMKHHGYNPPASVPSTVASIPTVAPAAVSSNITNPVADVPTTIPSSGRTPISAYLTDEDIARIERRAGNLRPVIRGNNDTVIEPVPAVEVEAPSPVAVATQCLLRPLTANGSGMYIPQGTEGRVLREGGQIGFLVNGVTYDLTGKSPSFGSC